MDSVLREEQVLRRERGIQGGDGSRPRLSRAPTPHRARRKFVHEDMEARWALALKRLSLRFVQRVLQTRNDANYRTPKDKSRSILPMRADWIQNLFVPIERFLNTAIQFRRRSSGCMIFSSKDTICLGSQNWRARPSAILASVLPLGGLSLLFSPPLGRVPPGDFQKMY